MKRILICIVVLVLLTTIACERDNGRFRVEIPDFNFPETITFEQNLSSYNIFQDSSSSLKPSNDYHLLELNSVLFTDYAHKQRLVKVPSSTQITKLDDGTIDFPNGTILVKTFFYYKDERDTTLGKRVIESRLLIKESDIWNVATYLWNDAQTDAILELNGFDTQINWINSNGNNRSTLYHVPNENECITCHQSKSTMIPLGTKLRNLNRVVERNGTTLNQINHLQLVGVLNDFETSQIPKIVDYNDLNASLAERGRAYLDMNCAHCHNPDAWDESADEDYDFGYETQLDETNISDNKREIINNLLDEEMPFIGTTIFDQEGVSLVVEFIESL